MRLPRDTDVFVVGAGPAGLAAAIAARQKGLRVIAADCAHPPVDKPCGEGLMPGALAALRALGITVGRQHSFPFRGIRFLGDGVSVDAGFPKGHALGVRRTVLHGLLAGRAADAGVLLLWDTPVSALTAEGISLDGHTVRCRWVIGADGPNSRVRRWAGLDDSRHQKLRYAFRRHYRRAPWTDCVEIYWGAASQIYVTPVGAEEVCVASISRDPHARLDGVLPMFPQLAGRLRGAVPSSSERGALSASRRLPRVARGHVVLIGDASGSVDAITGDGLSLAFRQAAALAGALQSGDLAAYHAEHARLARRPAFMASLLLSLDRHAWLRRRVLRALSARPAIFASLMAMHVGALSRAEFVIHGMLPLGWHLLAV